MLTGTINRCQQWPVNGKFFDIKDMDNVLLSVVADRGELEVCIQIPARQQYYYFKI